MSEKREKPDRDRALRGWDERRRAAKDLDGLAGRIMTAHGQGDAVVRPGAPAAAGPWRHKPAAWFAVGSVAATLVAALLLSVFFNRADTLVPDDLPPQYAWLNESQLREKAALLREIEPMFENRLQWIAETEGRVVMQVRQGGDREASDREAVAKPAGVAIRVVVVRRDRGSNQWTPVWAVDVIARQEQVVHLTPANADLPPGTELLLWAYAVDDDVIAVDSSLSLAEPSLQVEFNDVQRSGIPTTVYPTAVHEVPTDGPRYRVFQTIAILDSEV